MLLIFLNVNVLNVLQLVLRFTAHSTNNNTNDLLHSYIAALNQAFPSQEKALYD